MATKTAAYGTKARGGRSTREAILEAASRLIHVHGYNHTSLDDALHEAQRRGDINDDCRPEAVAHFLVASLEGAILLTKLTKDIAVMEQCVDEMKRHLSLYELGA